MQSKSWNVCFSVRKFVIFICFLSFNSPLLFARSVYADESINTVNKEPDKSDDVGKNSVFAIAAAKPNFTKLAHYKVFYGQPSWQAMLRMGKHYQDFGPLSLGAGFGLSFYTAGGTQQELKEGSSLPASSDEDFVKVSGDKLSLSLFSYEVSLLAKFKVPGFRYVNLDSMLGYQELYFEETRVLESQASEQTSDAKPYVNRGWNNGSVLTVSLNILLNPLDEAGTQSLRRTMGFGSIYLSPFIRKATKISSKLPAGRTSKKADFISQNAVGIAFQFETF